MGYKNKTFCIEVVGDYACFTRPEMKVERVSYDVPTPSAARGVFTAIFWKPAIRWHVTQIDVLKPIRWISLRRNEVSSVATAGSEGILVEDDRTQRAGLFLRKVAYRFHAELEFVNTESKEKDENPGKYHGIFERRASKGQCFYQPYLGCREFSCDFRLVENLDEEALQKPAIDETRDLGFMLYDMDFSDEKNPKPMFYRPKMDKGVILVPPKDSEEVRK
jgi:CRISPR-associated protein Cas5d